MPFRICVVGCGRHSSFVHGPAYKKYAHESSDTVLAACCDLDAERAEAFRESFGFQRAYTDLHEMMKTERPDAVCLVTHVDFTCPVGCELLSYGVPLIMEKPPGLTTVETDKLIAAAGDTPHLIAFNRRFAPLMRHLRADLDKTVPPEAIHHIRYDFVRHNRPDDDFSTTAIHGIDAVRFLARADYRHVSFHYQHLPEAGPQVANIYMQATMTSGANAYLSFHPMAGTVLERAEIAALDHTWLLHVPIWNCHDGNGLLQHLADNTLVLDVTDKDVGDGPEMFEQSGFHGENRAFFEAVRQGLPLSPTLKESRQSVAIAQCIRERRSSFEA